MVMACEPYDSHSFKPELDAELSARRATIVMERESMEHIERLRIEEEIPSREIEELQSDIQ